MREGFLHRGWCAFPAEPAVSAWAAHARKAARLTLSDPANAGQWQCDGTWFVGLEALANDAAGQLEGGPPLCGEAVTFAAGQAGGLPPLHRAQVSVIRPGYPRPREGETEAAAGYRLRRDAAHVDGVLGLGTPKRRFIKEPHAFVLGLPLNKASPDAAPMVIWEGSHEIMRAAFRTVLQDHPPGAWGEVDVTAAYQAARRTCFEDCRRVAVHVDPGCAYVVHRLALHGVSPWGEKAGADPEGRMIAYLRPDLPGGLPDWLNRP